MDSISCIDHPLYRIRDPEFTELGLKRLIDRIKDILPKYIDAGINIADALQCHALGDL